MRVSLNAVSRDGARWGLEHLNSSPDWDRLLILLMDESVIDP